MPGPQHMLPEQEAQEAYKEHCRYKGRRRALVLLFFFSDGVTPAPIICRPHEHTE